MNQPAPSPDVPETNVAREIGGQMARLREQFGLSQQEVSERLHIRTRYVSAIEEGHYELMPGMVYARGYVQTYAEFLGLNPDETVAKCFAGELPASKQPLAPPRYASPTSRNSISNSSGKWRGYAVLGAIALVLVVVVSQFMGRGDDSFKVEETTVAPVPEAMLASVRTLVMPLPTNYDCLMTDALLACFAADETARVLNHINVDGLHYGGPIDVSSLILALPAADEDAAADAENPDSPAVATEVVVDDAAPHDTPEQVTPNEPGPPHD